MRGNITDNKIKSLTLRELTVAIDRLTRFKYTEDKYLRVFKDVILSNLIEPKFKKKDLDNMDYQILRDYAQNVINESIANNFGTVINNDYSINDKLKNYENSLFYLNESTNILLDNKIYYATFIQSISEASPLNLQWLKSLGDSSYISNKFPLKFPIRYVIIVEGITEEILLPVFADKCGFNFDNNGIQVVSAGGKNQVVKLFYTFAEQLRVPMFVLLDSDAEENYGQINLKLRNFDKIHLLKGGEFEDILPKTLIERTLNDYFINLNSIDDDDFANERMVLNLEEIFKKKGFHEFKKSEFAVLIKSHIETLEDVSDEIKDIIAEISANLVS